MDRTEILPLISDGARKYSDRIIEIYNAPFARNLGIEIESISEDEVSLYLDIVPEHINSRGFVHGAVIYGLADHTLAFASGLSEDTVGQCTNIIYHRPVKEGRLVSRSRLVNKSKNLKIFDISVSSNGKLISSATFTAFRLESGQ